MRLNQLPAIAVLFIMLVPVITVIASDESSAAGRESTIVVSELFISPDNLVSNDTSDNVYGAVDWNGDGDWDDPGEKVIGTGSGTVYPQYGTDTVTIDPVVDFPYGENSLTVRFRITPPDDAVLDSSTVSYARFRLDYGEDVLDVMALEKTGE